MRGLKLFGASTLLLLAGATQAGVTGTVTAVNDYDFRGTTISGTDPALQGSVDWSGGSGFYAGAWGSSSIDFGPGTDSSYEVDLYVGITGGEAESFTWDGGI